MNTISYRETSVVPSRHTGIRSKSIKRHMDKMYNKIKEQQTEINRLRCMRLTINSSLAEFKSNDDLYQLHKDVIDGLEAVAGKY